MNGISGLLWEHHAVFPGRTASDDIGGATTHRLRSSVAGIVEQMFEHAGWPESPDYGLFFVWFSFHSIYGVQSEASNSADAEPAHNAGFCV